MKLPGNTLEKSFRASPVRLNEAGGRAGEEDARASERRRAHVRPQKASVIRRIPATRALSGVAVASTQNTKRIKGHTKRTCDHERNDGTPCGTSANVSTDETLHSSDYRRNRRPSSFFLPPRRTSSWSSPRVEKGSANERQSFVFGLGRARRIVRGLPFGLLVCPSSPLSVHSFASLRRKLTWQWSVKLT